MTDLTPDQIAALGIASSLVDEALNPSRQPWEQATLVQAARAAAAGLPAEAAARITERLAAAESDALHATVNYQPTAAEILNAMEHLDTIDGLPDKVLQDLRLEIKRTDPHSPEYQAASDLLIERNRRRFGIS